MPEARRAATPRNGSAGGAAMSEYKVKFEIFEGPLDLLLYLIKKEEVDIYEVNLTRLAEQFIEYIELMRELDLDVAGEFLVMAATLMYIKSRELLPVDQRAEAQDEDEGDDPRWELIRQLVAYKKFKDAAARLQELELRQEAIYPRAPARPEVEAPAPPVRPEVSIFDLLSAVNEVLKRFSARTELRDIFEDRWTVSDKIGHILRVLAERGRALFSELFAGAASRTEVVVTFLALLELIRLKQVTAHQPEEFGEIELRRALVAEPIAAPVLVAVEAAEPTASASPATASPQPTAV
ncbi:MAG: segregation/condensation protein A [Verrucomicrobiales bacterium]|nr:segregation/condensation protein A [Verrucomicrobiales bacterium]